MTSPIIYHAECAHLDIPPFPTRRSSDLGDYTVRVPRSRCMKTSNFFQPARKNQQHQVSRRVRRRDISCVSDRKSTRLNSSHLVISYAVFSLKKKKLKFLSTFTSTLTKRS